MHTLMMDRFRTLEVAQPLSVGPSTRTDERVRRVVFLMEQNLGTPLSIADLARRVGVSTRQLDRLFQQQIGMVPLTYYRQLRLNYARWMLIHSRQSITQIALEAGFSDCAHLSRQFRAAFGVPPSALRALERDRSV